MLELVVALALQAAPGAAPAAAAPAPSAAKAPESTAMNPLLAPWTGPHGGVPPFASVKVEH
jgi:peptidyl-dipeptidase Dcp